MNVKDKVNFIERTDIVNYYLDEIRQYDVLTPEEEANLFRKIANGDENAKSQIIKANQKFVFSIAKSYGGGAKLMDLVNEGNIGLIRAIDTFDVTKGYKFISYAVWYIRREINLYLINEGMLVKKSNYTKTCNKVTKIKNEYFAKNGRFPSYDEISDILKDKYGIEIKTNVDLFDVNFNSIDSSLDDGESSYEESDEFVNKTSSVNEYNKISDENYNKALVASLISRLSKREQEIIKLSFGIGYDREYSIYEISKIVGLTSERVRQIRLSVLKTMKNMIGSTVKKAI